MPLTPRLRKCALVAHITTTVGWLGAIAVFLALAVIGLTSAHTPTVRGVFLVMEPAAAYVLLPLAVASLLTGIMQSLGTRWGLFQHYWVVFKLLIAGVATTLLLIYMDTFAFMARAAADPESSGADLRALAFSPILHATLALLGLLVATVMAVYKPRGRTPYGQRVRNRA